MAKKSGFPRWLLVLLIIGFLGFMLISWVVSSYNSMVELDGQVENAWAQVETQYQRRADLIPSLVSTVQGAADFENSTLTEVTAARSAWAETAGDEDASLQEQMDAASSFDSALSRLLVTVESYPTLTATEGFQTLQSQLEGTENRISVARKDFNDTATTYNVAVRRIPMVFFASLFGFEQYPLFESEEGSEDAPEVEFDFGNE